MRRGMRAAIASLAVNRREAAAIPSSIKVESQARSPDGMIPIPYTADGLSDLRNGE